MKEIMERINNYNGMIDYVLKDDSWVKLQRWSQTVDAMEGENSGYTRNYVRMSDFRSYELGGGSEMVELLNVGDENHLETSCGGETEHGDRVTQQDSGVDNRPWCGESNLYMVDVVGELCIDERCTYIGVRVGEPRTNALSGGSKVVVLKNCGERRVSSI